MGETGIIDLTFILEAGGVLKGEGPISINYGRSFVRILILFRSWVLASSLVFGRLFYERKR